MFPRIESWIISASSNVMVRLPVLNIVRRLRYLTPLACSKGSEELRLPLFAQAPPVPGREEENNTDESE